MVRFEVGSWVCGLKNSRLGSRQRAKQHREGASEDDLYRARRLMLTADMGPGIDRALHSKGGGAGTLPLTPSLTTDVTCRLLKREMWENIHFSDAPPLTGHAKPTLPPTEPIFPCTWQISHAHWTDVSKSTFYEERGVINRNALHAHTTYYQLPFISPRRKCDLLSLVSHLIHSFHYRVFVSNNR